jgi:hypothetical protein
MQGVFFQVLNHQRTKSGPPGKKGGVFFLFLWLFRPTVPTVKNKIVHANTSQETSFFSIAVAKKQNQKRKKENAKASGVPPGAATPWAASHFFCKK